MSTTYTGSTTHTGPTTHTGARRRTDNSLAGQLNVEWDHLCADPATAATVTGWATTHSALTGCASLASIERTVTGTASSTATDAILLALLTLAHDGERLAGRTVLQLMLGKAIRLAASHTGRDTRSSLEQITIAALWTVIATYPLDRRPTKVAANIAMDTLHAVTAELAHDRHETPTSPDNLRPTTAQPHEPADLELINLLAWAVDHHAITHGDAVLILDIYAPAPGETGGAAAAVKHGVTWSAARQRASRAIRKITRALHDDGHVGSQTGDALAA